MDKRELPNEGREPSLKVNFSIGRRRPLTLWDLIDDLRELADEGFGDHEPGVSTIVFRPHVETESERKARLLAEASNELRDERSGRRKRKPTRTNPTGTTRQCDRRDVHEPHEYQGEFGAYFNIFCPGNLGDKP